MDINLKAENEHYWHSEPLTMEEQIEVYNRDKKRLEALQRLSNNPDFVYLLFNQLFVIEASDCVKLIESETALNNEKFKNIVESKLLTISGLQRWFNNIIANGKNADENIKALEEEEEDK